MKLDSRNVKTLIAPAGKDDVVIWDDTMPGFGVRLRGDNRTYLIQFRVGVQQRRESLGDIRKVKLEDAKKVARQRFAQAQLGQDPARERHAAKLEAAAKRLTFGVVAERYLEAKKARLRPTSYADARRYFTRHWASLRDWPIAVIQRANVAAGLQDIIKAHGPVSAARARANLSALFTWAIGEGLVDINPVIGTNNPEGGHQSRTRVRVACPFSGLLVPTTGLVSTNPSPIAQVNSADRLARARAADTGPCLLMMVCRTAATLASLIAAIGQSRSAAQ